VAWYWWVLLWVVVLLLALGVLTLFARSLWRKASELLKELAAASDQLQVVNEGLQQLAERTRSDPAVFTPAAQLRQEQILAGRARGRRPSRTVK
jgi:hypothetical protein